MRLESAEEMNQGKNKKVNCVICEKKLSFWNQPLGGKGMLAGGEKLCSRCFLKVNWKSSKTAANLKTYSLRDVQHLLFDKTPNTPSNDTEPIITAANGDEYGVISHLSPKLVRILRSKTDLSDQELNNISESEGWDIVYSLSPPKSKKTEICFSGFSLTERERLFQKALEHDFHVTKSITKNLKYLCIGPVPGEKKLQLAKKQGVLILSRTQFFDLLETGEIPE